MCSFPIVRYILFLCYCLMLPVLVNAQGQYFNKIPLSYLGIEDGLSNNAVNSIYQDYYGFMWFGTYDGLSQYDGYTFKVFRNRPKDSTSLINNWVVAIKEDYLHRIWVGTKHGASLYNRVTSDFAPVYYRSFKDRALGRISAAINDIETDRHGNVFIATAGQGLMVFRKGEDVAIQIPFNEWKHQGTGYFVQALKMDGHQKLWMFIQGVGLCVYDSKANQIKVIYYNLKNAKSIQPDYMGIIWIGNENGLYEFNIKTKTHIKHSDSKGFLSNNHVHGLTLDKKGLLWISTDGGGLTILNTRTRKLDYLLPSKERGALTSGAVYTVFEDKDERKWIGTLRGGVNILDERKNRFTTIAQDLVSKNSLVGNFILSFCEDEKGNLWIGTDGQGISYWNRTKNTFRNFVHKSTDPSSLSSNNVARIIKDHRNDIWVASYGGGVNRLDKKTGSFVHYPCYNSVFGYDDKNAWTLYEDRFRNLWAGTLTGGGLYLLNRSKNKFELFDEKVSDVITMAEDRGGNLWAGNFNELIKIDLKGKKHERYMIQRSVRAIHEDRKGNFWVGTEGGGLLNFNRRTRAYKEYIDSDGLPNNSVLNILEDKTGCLWISTFSGLSKFNPENKFFKNFYGNDGLQSSQFNYNAALALASGEFVFGGIKGFNIFYPCNIKPYKNSSKLLISGLNINNVPYERENTLKNKTSIYTLQDLKLPYDKAVLSINFVRPEYTDPEKINYSYILEGWDNAWTNAGKQRTANYSKLREGKYLFRVRAFNSEKPGLESEKVLTLTIMAPWWRSWWAHESPSQRRSNACELSDLQAFIV